MNTGNRFQIVTVVVVTTLFSVFSSPRPTFNINGFNLKHTPFPFFITTPSMGSLAKTAAARQDSLVVTRINVYEWQATDWNPAGNIRLTYDDRGRIIECIDTSLSEDSIYTHTTYAYDEPGKSIRETVSTRIVSSSFPSTGLDVIDYYYGDQVTFNNFLMSSSSFSELNLGNSTTPAIDSAIYLYSLWDSLTQSWDTLSHFKYSYSYGVNSVTTSYEERMIGSGNPPVDEYEYAYRLNAAGLVDTLIGYGFTTEGTQYTYALISYDYQNGKPISMLMEISGSEMGLFPMEQKITIAYSPSGLTESYTTEFRRSRSDPWKQMTKMIFVYSPLSAPVIKTLPLQKSIGSLAATWKQGTLQLTAPSCMQIAEILQFDMQGRLVSRFRPAGTHQPGEPVTLPLRVPTGSITLLQVRTDRGSAHLKVNAAVLK